MKNKNLTKLKGRGFLLAFFFVASVLSAGSLFGAYAVNDWLYSDQTSLVEDDFNTGITAGQKSGINGQVLGVDDGSGAVKAAQSGTEENSLVFRVRTIFDESVEFTQGVAVDAFKVAGEMVVNGSAIIDGNLIVEPGFTLSASNVVYSLTGGDNVTVTGDQDLTISVDPSIITNSLGIFNRFTFDDDTITAVNNTDELTFASGTGISYSVDGQEVTITADGSVLNVSGWEGSGSNVILGTVGDNVGIGSASPAYKLDVDGVINLTEELRVAGDAGTSTYLLTSSGGGANTWTDPSSLSPWMNTLNVLHPARNTAEVVDLTIGGTSTASANVHLRADGQGYFAGNVGVGTISPSSKLDVVGSSDNVQIQLTANSTQTNSTNPLIQILASDGVTELFRITSDDVTNFFAGSSAGAGNVTGTAQYNTNIGSGAGQLQTTGDNNTAIGYQANYGNTDTTKSDVTAVGSYALYNNSANYSTGVGVNALYNNTGNTSTGIGHDSLRNNTGGFSVGVGANALYNNTGLYSTGGGDNALRNNSGQSGTGFGYRALYDNSGSSGTGVGAYSLYLNSGSASSGLGLYSLYQNAGTNATGIGLYTLRDNMGDHSNGIGSYSLGSNSGDSSSGIGAYSLRYNQGDNNIALGHNSFNNWTDNNTAIASSIAIDRDVGADDIITVDSTVAFGVVGSKVTLKVLNGGGIAPGGYYNGAYGTFEILSSTTLKPGNPNIITVDRGEFTLTDNVHVYTNSTALGYDAEPDASNQLMLGDGSLTQIKSTGSLYITGSNDNYFAGNIGIGSTTPAYALDVNGIAQIGSTLRVDSTSAIYSNSGVMYFGSNINREIRLRTNSGSDRMTINTSGNVGIGTTAPLGLLNIEGAATGKALTILNETGDQNIFVASASGVNRFVIQNDGNVGIGSTSPGATLDVTGTLQVSSVSYLSGGAITAFGNQLKINDNLELALGNSGDYSLGYNSADDTFRIVDGSDLAANARLTIDSSGDTTISGGFTSLGFTGSAVAGSDVRFDTTTKEVYYYTSSRRYKTDITDIEIDTTKLYDLKPVSFTPTNPLPGTDPVRTFGMIAEDTYEVIPEIVFWKDGQIEGITYSQLPVLLLNEVQKHEQKINTINDYLVNEQQIQLVDMSIALDEQGEVILEEDSSVAEIMNTNVEEISVISSLVALNEQSIASISGQVLGLIDDKTVFDTHFSLGDNLVTMYKEVKFRASVTFEQGIEFIEEVSFRGSVKFNSDTVGRFVIPSGATKVKIEFGGSFSQEPTVYLSPQSRIDGGYRLESIDTDSFIIQLDTAQSSGITIDWLAVLSSREDNAEVEVLEGDVSSPEPSIEPTPDPTSDPTPESTQSAELE